jgi:hypothetical protein
MSGDHDKCFSILVLGAFSTGVFNTNALPRINIDADVWGESSIMTGVYQRWCSFILFLKEQIKDIIISFAHRMESV